MPFPDVCVEDRETCPNEWPTLKYAQNACSKQQIQLRDDHGKHYDLNNRRVCLIAKEGIDAYLIKIAKVATIIDAQQGIVEVQLNQEDSREPGLFVGEFVIENLTIDDGSSSAEESSAEDGDESSEDNSEYAYSESDEESSSFDSSSLAEVIEDLCYIVAKLRCYVEIQEDLWHTDRQYHTLTIAEIRLGIRDKCREVNFLLDRVEFTDTEIAWALRRPVDYWNEALPPLSNHMTTMNFPYIYNWFDGVIGELMAMGSVHAERNALRYSAAGLSIDDKDTSVFYMKVADKYRTTYKDWVREKKRSINVGNAFGSTSLRSFDNHGGFR